MAESNQKKKKIPTDYISDSESSEEETNQYLHTSKEERLYHTIKRSAQATQAALVQTTAQCNPTVKRGPAKQLKIKPFPKDKPQIRQYRQKKKISPIDI